MYTIQAGDTYWIISRKYGVDINQLMAANNATPQTILNIGDEIVIPSQAQASKNTNYTVKSGDSYWIISRKFNRDIIGLMEYNGHNQNTVLYIGQKIGIPESSSKSNSNSPTNPTNSGKAYITYSSYTVQKGDTIWSLANKFGTPHQELVEANNITTGTVLNIGDMLKIPVHHVPIKDTPGEQYGEYLEWWTEA
ncbi:MAG: LysM peptidoglycan-binding domain-containing protein [Clostridiales bacterium]|nr:LysM peptidoglycan-binding domain-containing protein [Clostridiales bacterium]